MKALGVRIALDDFGSGYSNFSYLMELKPDFIKIDGSLIKEIDTNNNSYIIVKTIANFSNELNIDVIAEYIHSKEVYEKTRELNITGFQGYYLGEPTQIIPKD
jgi:EAL domain-containing protein (putative c-di-GMP-specific phosphodiesterase class I)